MEKKLTKPQIKALRKWEDGRVYNHNDLRVRTDVFWRLCKRNYVRRISGTESSVITKKGECFLSALDFKL